MEKERNQKHRGAERTDLDRADDRERKQRSRDKQYAARDAEHLESLDPGEARFRKMWAEAMAQPITKPGERIPPTDPEVIKARNEKFDREKEESERKASLEARRTIFALAHGIPIWRATPDDFPPDLR